MKLKECLKSNKIKIRISLFLLLLLLLLTLTLDYLAADSVLGSCKAINCTGITFIKFISGGFIYGFGNILVIISLLVTIIIPPSYYLSHSLIECYIKKK